MDNPLVKAYIVQATHAGKTWPQLLFVYGKHIAFCGREEATAALHQMHFGVKHTTIDQIVFHDQGLSVSLAKEMLLNELYTLVREQLPRPWVQAAFEYLIFGKVEVPVKMPRIYPWDAGAFQDAVIALAVSHAEHIEAIWSHGVGEAAAHSEAAATASNEVSMT